MKRYSSLIVSFFLLYLNLSAQVFTKITTGPVVTDINSTYGSAWVDYDHDNDLDLFVTNVSTQNDQLYINNGNGIFTTFTGNAIVEDSIYSYNSTWADMDKDGWEDCFITHGNYYAPNQFNTLFKNNQAGSFNKIPGGIATTDTGNSDGSTWGNYDNDGFIDLFIANFNTTNNFLYHNERNGTFSKVLTGSIATDIAFASASGAWGDYDNDGYLDLFVSNFGGPNFLYHNDTNGTFTRITTGDIVTETGDSHGASWGNYDNDGFLDLFVNRWSNQNDLLYNNNGNGTFTKILTGPVVNSAGFGTGSSWGDFDNDGDLDLAIGNSSANTGVQYNFLYENTGNGNFSIVNTTPFTNDLSYTRGLSWCDYDNDGDLDLHFANESHQNDFLYENQGNTNKWINIHLTGILSNHSAIGARVYAKAIINGSPVWQNNFVSSQTGYSGENSLNVEFGFGNATIIDSIIVQWPSGIDCYFTNVHTNLFVDIDEMCVLNTFVNINLNHRDENPFTVFPNPVINELYIKFNKEIKANTKIQVSDAVGRLVHEQKFSEGKIVSINCREFSTKSGLYLICVQTENNIYWQKIILQY